MPRKVTDLNSKLLFTTCVFFLEAGRECNERVAELEDDLEDEKKAKVRLEDLRKQVNTYLLLFVRSNFFKISARERFGGCSGRD